MVKKNLHTENLVEISNKVTKVLIDELGDDEQTVNPADMVCVLAIIHRTLFANIERQKGIEQAREETGFLVDLVGTTLKSGAWDEENQCMK